MRCHTLNVAQLLAPNCAFQLQRAAGHAINPSDMLGEPGFPELFGDIIP